MPWNKYEGKKVPKRSGISHKLNKIADERGRFGEKRVCQALYELRDYYGVPIIVITSEKGGRKDRQGVDVEVRGRDPLHARFGIDVKSSRRGVEEYLQKARELEASGVRMAYPRYPFLFQNDYRRELLVDLLRLMLSKSKSHEHALEYIPPFREIEFQNFEQEFRSLIEKIFS